MEPSQPVIPVEEQFKIMADTAPVMIWISGIDKLCYFFNTGWLRFTGRTMAQEYGDGWAEGVHPDDLQRCLDIYTNSFNVREAFRMEYRLKRFDNEYRWLLDNGVPRYTADGVFAGYIGSCVDIDDIIRSEKLKDEFISAASHELKTPLTTIKIYTQLLQGFFKKEAFLKQSGFVDKIAGQINKLNRLINSLLDVSKIRDGALILNKEPANLFLLVQSEVNNIKLKHPAYNICIKNDVADAVRLDKERICQVINNLLDNAVKYSPDKNRIDIAISQYDDDGISVSVQDYGIGISKKYLGHIFERFYRVSDNDASTYPGLGIGLFIAHEIVEAHNGCLIVESKEGQGTKMTFTIKDQQ